MKKHPHGIKLCDAPPAEWRVTDYKCNYSAFNGYHYTPSNYSQVRCLRCGWFWRSNGKYVDGLATATEEEGMRAI